MGNTGLLPIITEELKNYIDDLEKIKKNRTRVEQYTKEINNVSKILENLKPYRLYYVKRALTTYLNERVVGSNDEDSDEHKFKLEKLIEAIRL